MDLKDFVKNNKLIEIYGDFLTKSQLKILKDYFVYNLSMSEISENEGISRAAVNDAIKVSLEKLNNYEDVLHVLEKNESIIKIVEEMKKENDPKLEKYIKELGK